MVGLTRRTLLARGAAAGVGLVAAGCGGSSGRPAPSAAQTDVALLRRALEAERASETLYAEVAVERAAERRLVRRLRAAERRHVEVFEAAVVRLGGRRGEVDAFADGEGDLEAALADEQRSIDRYLELLPRLRTPEVRTLVGYVLAEDAAHAAALRAALGRQPLRGAFV